MNDYIPSEDELAASSSAAFESAAPALVAPRPVHRAAPAPELPPHDLEAEQGVIGCILLDPGASMDLLSEQLQRAGEEAFYDLRHRTIYAAVAALWERQTHIDIITLKQSR